MITNNKNQNTVYKLFCLTLLRELNATQFLKFIWNIIKIANLKNLKNENENGWIYCGQ